MIELYKFLIKIKPDGKAFRSILFSKVFYEVLAYAFNLIKDYAILTINDQVWYVNDNFDPEPWEARYLINVPALATDQERRDVVKSYMLFPQSENRLSKDYIQQTLLDAGFTDLLVEYNSAGSSTGIFRINDFGEEKASFVLGSKAYNTFIVSGEIGETYYSSSITTIMSLMPLQVGFYDQMTVVNAMALNDTYAIALNSNYTIAITVL